MKQDVKKEYNKAILRIPMPERIAKLPVNDQGFPVPWFVQWMKDKETTCEWGEGYPEFRVIDSAKLAKCARLRKASPPCWICGEPLGRHRVFVIGPMCSVNRVISEPPSHRECAEYAIRTCPFLANPRMVRNEKDLPDGESAGVAILRNPGTMCLWETQEYKPFRTSGGPHFLFSLGDPDRVEWWTKGRLATQEEVVEAMESGLPILMEMAKKEGRESVESLKKQRIRAYKYIPKS